MHFAESPMLSFCRREDFLVATWASAPQAALPVLFEPFFQEPKAALGTAPILALFSVPGLLALGHATVAPGASPTKAVFDVRRPLGELHPGPTVTTPPVVAAFPVRFFLGGIETLPALHTPPLWASLPMFLPVSHGNWVATIIATDIGASTL